MTPLPSFGNLGGGVDWAAGVTVQLAGGNIYGMKSFSLRQVVGIST
jgi:hypothetical protein